MNTAKVTLRPADPLCHTKRKCSGEKAIIYNPFHDYKPYSTLIIRRVGDIKEADMLEATLPRWRNKVALYMLYSECEKVTPRPRLLAVVKLGSLPWYYGFQRRIGLIRRLYVSFERDDLEQREEQWKE